MNYSHSRNLAVILGLAFAAIPVALRAAAAGSPTPFTEATVSEVINDVSVSPANDPSTKEPAVKGMDFKAPDIIQTGRRSRAQLTAADGTIARVGSNTVFSLEPNSRTINLKEGSVLFNSPKGIGGGTIVTNSATATVTGTTIIVSATPDGGFKLLVLEGTATMTLPNGQTLTLNAGEMSFVLPAAKGGGAGPVLNFDLKKEAESSSLVNGFTVTLPSQNLIVDATQIQQQKIQSGQLTETNQVVLGAVSADKVVLATVNTVDTIPNNSAPAYPDLTLGPTGEETLPSANAFTTPQTISAGALGLPGGVLPQNAYSITGLIGQNVFASGTVNLAANVTSGSSSVGPSLDGLAELDILAQNTFTFTSNNTETLKTPSLAGTGSSSGGPPARSSNYRYSSTDFEGLTSTLNLHLIADKGFVVPEFVPQVQPAVTPAGVIGYEIDVDFNPTSFSTPSYYDEECIVTPGLVTTALATPAYESQSIPTFLTQFTMTSVLEDMNITNLDVYDDNDTGNIKMESILGNVSGSRGDIEAGQDVVLSSTLGGINLTDTYLQSGEIDNGEASNITLVAGVGNIVLASTGTTDDYFSTYLETDYSSPYNGTVSIITPGNVTISNTTIESKTQDLIAGGTLSVSNSSINNGSSMVSGTTYTYAGDTVVLGNVAFTGCSVLNLYSKTGQLNTNTSIVIPGDVNLAGNVSYGSYCLTSSSFGTSSIPDIGLTSDNSTVQAALGTALAITNNTTSFDPSLTFANVLFSPSQLGEAYGDTYFAVIHGLIAGAVTINGSFDLSSLDSFNGEADLGAKSVAISGCIAITLPSDTSNLQVFSEGNISLASGTYAYDNSGCFDLTLSAIKTVSFNDAALYNDMGAITLNALDGGISIANGSTLSSGSSDTETSGNINVNTLNNSAGVMITNSTLTTYRGPITVTSDNISIANLSTLTAPCQTITLNGGQTGIALNNSTLDAGSMSGSLVNLYSYNNITITNNSTINSYTGTSNLDSPRVVLTAAHTVTVTNSVISTSFSSTNAVDTITENNVAYNNASQINMTARTINLSNINFPAESQVYLTSQNGVLAPNPNTSANPVVGDVNFITNVKYNGSPAQNYVPTSVGGAGTGDQPIHISSTVR